MYKKYKLLNKNPKNRSTIYFIILFFISTISSFSYYYKSYDSLNVTGIITCEETCKISISLPYDKIDILQYDDLKLSYLNEFYEIEKIIYSEPYLSNNVPFQDIEIRVKLKSSDERIINIRLLYNEQRIIKKIIDRITKGE